MSTTWPRPLRRAWKIASRSPLAPWMAVQLSVSGTVTGSGARSGNPVTNCTPEKAWAMRSSPRSPASGPVCPNGEMRSVTSRGLRRSSASGDSPAASRRPGPRSSISASAVASSRASHGSVESSPSSACTECLPRFSDWKASASSPGRPGPRWRIGDPPGGSILTTVAPRSARSPPASSPAGVWASSTITTPTSAPPRSPSGRPSAPVMAASRQPEDAGRVAVEPLLLDRVLQRQPEILLDQRLVGLPDEPGRQADHHLVLDQGIAELDQHLPARAGLAEVPRAMRGGVDMQVRIPAHERDHLVHPGPAAEPADDLELREVHRHLVEVARMPEVVGPVVGVVHRGVDAHRDAQLGRLGVERVVAAVARRKAVDQRGDAEGAEALLAHQALELAHPAHALVLDDADPGQPEEPAGKPPQELPGLGVGQAERHGAHDAEGGNVLHIGVQIALRPMIGALPAGAEDP